MKKLISWFIFLGILSFGSNFNLYSMAGSSGGTGPFSGAQDESSDSETEETPRCRPAAGPRPVTYDNEAYQRLIYRTSTDEVLDLTGVNFHGADLREANLTLVILNNAILISVNLENNRSIDRTKFKFANLTDACLKATCINNANFTKANLTRANFGSAKISESIFNETILKDTSFDRAILDEDLFMNITNAIATNPSFRRATLRDTRFAEVYFDGVDFRNAILISTKTFHGKPCMCFFKCKLNNTEMEDASLIAVFFDESLIPRPYEENVLKTLWPAITALGANYLGIALCCTPAAPWLCVGLVFGSLVGAAPAGVGTGYLSEKRNELIAIGKSPCRGLNRLFKAQNCMFYHCEGFDEETKKQLENYGSEITDKEDILLKFVKALGLTVAAHSAGGLTSGATAAFGKAGAEAFIKKQQ